MRNRLQSSTAHPMTFFITQTDHITGATGLSPTITISKDGGSFGSPSGSVTEIANGWYALAGNATDRNTLGAFLIHVAGTGSNDPSDTQYNIVGYDPYNSSTLGLSGFASTALASNGLDGITVETGLNPRQALAIIASALAGQLSGAATSTVVMQAANNSGTQRISTAVDASGDRTSVTLNIPT